MITAADVRERVHTLPSLPTTLVSLGQAVADERCTVDRLVGILAKDPPLSATMLRLANSLAYAGGKEVTELRVAIQRLGYDAILNLGRTAAIIRSYGNAKHLDAVRLWQHSVAVGLTAKAIARLLRRHSMEESAFLGGLLHDIGKIALDRCFTDLYGPVVEAVEAGETMLEAERRLLGITHQEVGGMVAEYWNFAPLLVEVIGTHHEPREGAWLPALVNLADLLVRTRIPNCVADESLVFALSEVPAFQIVFAVAKEETDLERLTFSIDDELDHAVAFVKLAFQD